MSSRASADAATRRLQRLRMRGLTLDARIDPSIAGTAPLLGSAPWTSERVAAVVERALHALADAPREPLLTPYVLGALLTGEWASARAWLERVPAVSAERVLLTAACHAFTGDAPPATVPSDAVPHSAAELRARLQAAQAAAASDDERAVCAFVALVHQLLGPEPDAVRDRLTLRIELPPDWQACSARNLRMGDGAFDVGMTHVGQGVRVQVDQTEGALPATLILEATVRAPVIAVEIDGRRADLALRPAADHVVVPVQLVLDAPRVMQITLQTT